MAEESASQSVAALLRSYRRAAGLTQEQLAERAGLSVRGVSDLERDEQRVPRRETLDLLLRALDLGPAERAALERAIRQTRAQGQPAAPAQGQGAPPAPAPAAPTAPTAALPTGMLSVLIADVRGYSTFTHQYGDAAGARLALRFTGLAEAVIAAAGGRMVEVRGDEVLGVFTSAHAALRAATGLVARCAEEATADLPLRAGVGLDAGEPIAVPGGYRGEVINTAARLCAQAGPGEVLASEVVVALARRVEGLVYQDRGALALKGLSRPVQTWLVRAGGETEEPAPPAAIAHTAATLAAGFATLPVEYQQVIRLAQDRYHIGVTPLQALAGGWSGAMVYLVNVSFHNPERLEHLVLKLDRKNEKAQSDETRRHDAAVRQSPPGFAAQHLAQMAFEPVEVEGALGIFYAIAGQSLHQYRTIGAYEEQSQVEAIFSHIYQYLLSDWNAARTFKHVAHPAALLEQWLSFRLKPGGNMDTFLETVCHVPPGIPGFLIRGSIFPNPLAYARTPEWWGAIRPLDAMVGLQHGDLNTNNMLIKFAKSGGAVEDYYLIDFALFKEQMPLVFDLRYLEMSYLLLRQSQISFAKVADLIARLGEADTLDPQQVPIDVAGLCGVIGATRHAYARWIDDHHASLHDDLWGQFWLAGVAAGLCYCHKPGLGDEQRMLGLVYAAANLKRYAALFGMPTPSEGRQLYDASQAGPDTPTVSPSPASAATSPTHLPAQATAFIGRETELSSLTALLSDSHNRLVTIVAPGGMGKTRLALEAAEQLQPAFPQGVYFIALDRISSPDLIVQAVAEALPISLSSKEDPRSRIIGYLQDKATLLVMDNFEHVLDGAVFVQDLLGSAPRVQVLATSRARLNLMSETQFTIEGLTVDEISPQKNSALQLFAQSARRTHPGFELNGAVLPAVTRICRRVDGMPLAIVLAAAWIDTLSADEIAAEIEKSIDILETELRDVSDRQRSVRAVVEWSWNQVDASAQDLLKRLAVFRGGFTRTAAQDAAGASLRGLAHLVDKALVRRDPKTGRYSIHELLRQYAEEQLVRSADLEESAHEAHAKYVADFMTACGIRVHDHRLKAALLDIEADIDNIRVAWDYWADKQDARSLLAFVDAMWVFFEVRGSFTPAIQFFGDAAKKLTADAHDVVCARAELQAQKAWFTALIGLPEEGLLLARESVATLGRYNSGDIAVNTLQCVSINAIFLNRTEIVCQVAQDMLGRADRSGDAWERGFALVWSAYARLLTQQIGEAMQAGQEALAVFERLDNPFGVSVSAGLILGFSSMATGDIGAAKAYLLSGVQAAEAINYLRLLQICYDSLGTVALVESDTQQARQFFLKSLRISQECGQTREMLASLRDLATVYSAQGNLESALQLLAVVLNHPASDQNSLNRPERLRDEAEKLRVVIEARLDQARYRSAWETGQRRRLAGVVAQSLQDDRIDVQGTSL